MLLHIMRTWSCSLNCKGCKSPVAYSLWMPRHDHTRQNTLDGYHPYFTTKVGRISSIDHLTKYYFLYWRNDISERAETVCFWILFFHFLSSFPKYDLEIFSAMDHWDSLNAERPWCFLSDLLYSGDSYEEKSVIKSPIIPCTTEQQPINLA